MFSTRKLTARTNLRQICTTNLTNNIKKAFVLFKTLHVTQHSMTKKPLSAFLKFDVTYNHANLNTLFSKKLNLTIVSSTVSCIRREKSVIDRILRSLNGQNVTQDQRAQIVIQTKNWRWSLSQRKVVNMAFGDLLLKTVKPLTTKEYYARI